MPERLRLPVLLLLLFFPLWGCTDSRPAGELLVMCGAANQPPMTEIARLYEEKTGTAIRLVTGGSGALLAQIELSRQGDIYLPAAPDYLDTGSGRKLLLPDSIRRVSYLVPAIIVARGNPKGIKNLADLARPGIKVALANPETVCIGRYAVEILHKNKLLAPVLANVVVYGSSCAKTVNLVALHQVDAMIGWRVLHFWNPQRLDFIPIAGDRIPRLTYIPISITVYCRNRAAAAKFIDFIVSPAGKAIYRHWGYLTEENSARSFAARAAIGGSWRLPPTYYRLLGRRLPPAGGSGEKESGHDR